VNLCGVTTSASSTRLARCLVLRLTAVKTSPAVGARGSWAMRRGQLYRDHTTQTPSLYSHQDCSFIPHERCNRSRMRKPACRDSVMVLTCKKTRIAKSCGREAVGPANRNLGPTHHQRCVTSSFKHVHERYSHSRKLKHICKDLMVPRFDKHDADKSPLDVRARICCCQLQRVADSQTRHRHHTYRP